MRAAIEGTPEARGRILDRLTRKPISGALVEVKHCVQGAHASAITGKDGRFVVPPAWGEVYPMGTAVLIKGIGSVTASGYTKTTFQITPSPSVDYKYSELGDLLLNPSGEQLMDVNRP